MISPEAQAELERMFAEQSPEGVTLEQQLSEWETWEAQQALPEGFRFALTLPNRRV